MQNLLTSMQSISYLEHISDLAGNNENPNIVQMLRQKYFTDITAHVENYLKEQIDALKKGQDKVKSENVQDLSKVIEIIFQKSKQVEIEKMLDLFKMSLWDKFGQPNMMDFGGKFLSELPFDKQYGLILTFWQ